MNVRQPRHGVTPVIEAVEPIQETRRVGRDREIAAEQYLVIRIDRRVPVLDQHLVHVLDRIERAVAVLDDVRRIDGGGDRSAVSWRLYRADNRSCRPRIVSRISDSPASPGSRTIGTSCRWQNRSTTSSPSVPA